MDVLVFRLHQENGRGGAVIEPTYVLSAANSNSSGSHLSSIYSFQVGELSKQTAKRKTFARIGCEPSLLRGGALLEPDPVTSHQGKDTVVLYRVQAVDNYISFGQPRTLLAVPVATGDYYIRSHYFFLLRLQRERCQYLVYREICMRAYEADGT